MADQKNEAPFLMGRMWGRRWVLISLFIIILTGVAIYFFDQTDDSKFKPLDARPPAFRDQPEKAPVRLLNMPVDSPGKDKKDNKENDSTEWN